MAFIGYLIKKIKKTNHYLCRYILKPGSKVATYTCSVNMSNFIDYKKSEDLTNFQKNLIFKYFVNSKNTLYDNILSDEGGRFYHSQIKYMACRLDKNQSIELPPSDEMWELFDSRHYSITEEEYNNFYNLTPMHLPELDELDWEKYGLNGNEVGDYHGQIMNFKNTKNTFLWVVTETNVEHNVIYFSEKIVSFFT